MAHQRNPGVFLDSLSVALTCFFPFCFFSVQCGKSRAWVYVTFMKLPRAGTYSFDSSNSFIFVLLCFVSCPPFREILGAEETTRKLSFVVFTSLVALSTLIDPRGLIIIIIYSDVPLCLRYCVD